MIEQGITMKAVFLNFLYIPFVALLQYLGLDGEVLLIFTGLLIIDIITGWLKTLAIGEKPKSWRLANGIISKVVLVTIPLVMALAAKALHIDISWLFYVVIDALILSEVYSIFGNVYTMNTGKNVEEYDVLSKDTQTH